MYQAYFQVFLLIVGGGELITIEDSLLTVYGYQLFPIVTSYLVGNNRKFDVSDIFWGVLLIVKGTYDHWRSITECPWLPIVARSNQLISG